MNESRPGDGADIPDRMPFVPLQNEIGVGERVYEMDNDQRSIVRVLTSAEQESPFSDEDMEAQVDRCKKFARDLDEELLELKERYGIITPGVQYAIGALRENPNSVALYANVDRVDGVMLEAAADAGSVPEAEYDQFITGQVNYALDRIMDGTTIRKDILGAQNERQYMFGKLTPEDEADQILLVDIGMPAEPVPAEGAMSRSSRRRPDGTRPDPKPSLGVAIDLHVYGIDRLIAKREQQGYHLPQAAAAITAARTALMERWPAIVSPLEQKRQESQAA